MRRAVLADDLTGAGDAGVQYVKAGFRTTVWLNYERSVAPVEGEVVVIDLDSRRIDADAAYARLRSVLAQLGPVGPREVIKKIDSTLRGNVGAELRALLDALPGAFAIVCPAYPKNGRTLRAGVLLVDGVPVDRTDFGRDPFSPVHDARAGAHLGVPFAEIGLDEVRASRDVLAAAVDRARREGLRAVVIDAETDADLRGIAALSAVRDDILWAGSAGLIEQLGHGAPAGAVRAPAIGPVRGPILFLIGSLSVMTQRQIDAFAESPATWTERIDPLAALDGSPDALVRRARAALGEGRDVLLAIGGARQAAGTGRELRKRFIAASAPLVGPGLGAIVLSGGDIARAFCERHAVHGLALLAEAGPGIPLARAIGADLLLVTKAGGFGRSETYRDIVASLRSGVTA